METITDGRHTFEVVDCIPKGYEIWNIGDHMIPGYLPLCRMAKEQPFPGAQKIEVDTLKAIRTGGALEIMDAAIYGFETLADMVRYLENHQNPSKNTSTYFKVQKIKAAIPWMKELEERSAGKEKSLNNYKITFSNGDSLVTPMNATMEEARAYYLGKEFNLGAERDRLVRCVSVEPC